jgi:hypothetical protein
MGVKDCHVVLHLLVIRIIFMFFFQTPFPFILLRILRYFPLTIWDPCCVYGGSWTESFIKEIDTEQAVILSLCLNCTAFGVRNELNFEHDRHRMWSDGVILKKYRAINCENEAALCYDMYWYLLTAFVFPPGESVRSTCTKVGERQLYTEGATIHTKYRNTEYTKYKQTHRARKQI